MPRRLPLIAIVIVLALRGASGESLAEYPDQHEHRIRTTDGRLQSIVDEGVRFSTTFQTLVDRLDRSDVVVYVEFDRHPQDGLDGRLAFLGAHAGVRYVLVRVVFLHDRARQIAVVGHELRHAVEVADAPAIIDRRSMEHEYQRLGYERARAASERMFDTTAAIEAGTRVLRELRTGSAE